jgi:hypothetical protein
MLKQYTTHNSYKTTQENFSILVITAYKTGLPLMYRAYTKEWCGFKSE